MGRFNTRVAPILWAIGLLVAAVAVHPWDAELSAALYRNPELRADPELMRLATVLGFFGKGDVGVFLAGLAGVCGLRQKATAALLAMVLCVCMVFPLKALVMRERPRGASNASFPSADVATASAVAFTLAAGAVPATAAAGALVASVAVSRVYFGAHYPADALTGMALGILASLVASTLCTSRRWRLGLGFFMLATGVCMVIGVLPHVLGGKVIPTRFGFEMQEFLPIFWPFLLFAAAWRHLVLLSRSAFNRRNYLDHL